MQISTPVSFKRPKIRLSTTKSQLLRQEESIRKKRKYEEIENKVLNFESHNNYSIENSLVIMLNNSKALQEVSNFLSSSTSKKSFSALDSAVKKPTYVSVRPPKPVAILPHKSPAKIASNVTAFKSKEVPNFNLAHAKQFSKLKSIKDVVQRVCSLFYRDKKLINPNLFLKQG